MKTSSEEIISEIINNLTMDFVGDGGDTTVDNFYNGNIAFDEIKHVKSENRGGSTYCEYYSGINYKAGVDAEVLIKITEYSDPDDPDKVELLITAPGSDRYFRPYTCQSIVEGVLDAR